MLCPDVDNFRTNQRHRSRVKSGKVGDTSLKEEVAASVARLGAVRGVAVVQGRYKCMLLGPGRTK